MNSSKDIFKTAKFEEFNDVRKRHLAGQYVYLDIFEQRLYLLRYFYAYYYEYKLIMKKICELFDRVNVVSIGCGSGIDALALKKINYITNKDFRYIGIDIVEWLDSTINHIYG